MEYEYELKEHGFSGEEDYILKLTDMPFEEMFQISKMPEDALDVHAGAFEIATMREIYTEAIRKNALIPNGYVGELKGSQYMRQRRTWKNKKPGRNARMDFLTKTLEFTSRW